MVLYRCLPTNRTLREYVELLVHVRALLNRALQSYLWNQGGGRPKVSLLVHFPAGGKSKGIIGFSAIGIGDVRFRIREERKRNLDALKNIRPHRLRWAVGNCAEDETLAHLRELCSSQIGQWSTSAVLTIDFMDGKSHEPCPQCMNLIHALRSHLPTAIFSLTPAGRERSNF